MKLLTRKTGVWTIIFGIVIFLLNFLTYTLWDIDIDILGAMIFVLGLVIVIACGKSMKHSGKLLSRRNGVWLCIIAAAEILVTGYLPFVNGDIGGGIGAILFVLGLILVIVRWKQ